MIFAETGSHAIKGSRRPSPRPSVHDTMTASSVPMPHIPTAVMLGSVGLSKPPSHQGQIEEGDGGGTVGPAAEARAKKERKRAVRTVPRTSDHLDPKC